MLKLIAKIIRDNRRSRAAARRMAELAHAAPTDGCITG